LKSGILCGASEGGMSFRETATFQIMVRQDPEISQNLPQCLQRHFELIWQNLHESWYAKISKWGVRRRIEGERERVSKVSIKRVRIRLAVRRRVTRQSHSTFHIICI